MTETIAGIEYSKPHVILLQQTGIGTSELAARTCYDSFGSSESSSIQTLNEKFDELLTEPTAMNEVLENINEVDHSDLLDKLAWTHFHYSILEHANLTYLIKGTSRAVLQEHARHRIQAISVRSTRYTMSSLINAFIAAKNGGGKDFFIDTVETFDMFVTADRAYNRLEIGAMYDKLDFQSSKVEDFYAIAVAKSSLAFIDEFKGQAQALYDALQSGKKKRNVGDAFKHIITDNVKVDMVVTFNLRSLKNYLTLRDSGAAYFQIRWLAQEMIKVTPQKYLDLIIKKK